MAPYEELRRRSVSAGLWALGTFLFTILAKAAIPIELGRSRLGRQPDAG